METQTLEELVAIQDLLQRAHNVLEFEGYDISTYGRGTHGPRCFIGAVRTAAHVAPAPDYNPDLDVLDPGYGNGPELRSALSILDKIARPKLDEEDVKIVESIHRGRGRDGRFIERLGYLSDGGDGDWALGLFRAALTEVYKQIESVS